MHGWVPTYTSLCRQGRETSSLCPRYHGRVETVDHIHICAHPWATQCCQTLLHSFLESISKIHTPMQILHVLHNKPSQVFELPDTKYKHLNMPHRPTLILAIKHQNIIGWDLFFKGYTSTYWIHVYNDLMQHAKNHIILRIGTSNLLVLPSHCIKTSGMHETSIFMGKQKNDQSHHNTKRSKNRSLTFIDTHQASHHITNQLERSHYQLDYKVALNI